MTVTPRTAAPPRRGIVLVLVVALLALFAVVGLAFVLYAESEATAARVYRETQDLSYQPAQFHESPDALLNWALGQLIYPVPDDKSGVYTAIRGHDLARNMYGWNYTIDSRYAATGTTAAEAKRVGHVYDPAGQTNTVPFGGTGRLEGVVTLPSGQSPAQIDLNKFVNSTFFNYESALQSTQRADTVVRDPERQPQYQAPSGSQNDYRSLGLLFNNAAPQQPYVGGANPNYTFPDSNHMFLAAVRPSDGKVLIPSFYRPGQFETNGKLYDAANSNFSNESDNWTNAVGKYLILRPRPVDQITQKIAQANGLPWPMPPTLNASQKQIVRQLAMNGTIFPYPDDSGDVKNFAGAPGGNDSIWMQLNYPVRQTRNGKKYQAAFAYLVVDLDGRVNINVHGNIAGGRQNNNAAAQTHVSHSGFGRHEIDLGYVFDGGATKTTATQTEWKNLFLGVANATAGNVGGRYGSNVNAFGSRVPGAPRYTDYPPLPAAGGNVFYLPPLADEKAAPFYSPTDIDSSREPYLVPQPSGPPTLVAANSLPTTPFVFPTVAADMNGGTKWSGATGITMFPRFFGAAFNSPTYSGFGGGDVNASTIPLSERYLHPLLYNSLRPVKGNRVFADAELARMIARYRGNRDVASSPLAALMPTHFVNDVNAAKYRNSFTTRSFDMDRPGATPAMYEPFQQGVSTEFKYPNPASPTPTTITLPPGGMPLAAIGVNATTSTFSGKFPTVTGTTAAPSATIRQYPPTMTVPGPSVPAGQPPAILTGAYDMVRGRNKYGQPLDATKPNSYDPSVAPFYNDWRSAAAALGGVDVNRVLSDYPASIPTPLDAATVQQINVANGDRQSLAFDIFERLVMATGAKPPAQITDPAQAGTYRWLAQLAVNIVDYVDADDVSTAFNWVETYQARHPVNPLPNAIDQALRPTAWVYGVEQSKVLLNECYAEAVVDPADKQMTGSSTYHVNFWAELLNPLRDDLNSNTNANRSTAQLDGVYRMRVLEQGSSFDPATLRNPTSQNSLRGYPVDPNGNDDDTAAKGKVDSWGGTSGKPFLHPLNDAMTRTQAGAAPPVPTGLTGAAATAYATSPRGFYIVGPQDDFEGGGGTLTPDLKVTSNFSGTFPASGPDAARTQGGTVTPITSAPKYTFVLQRLLIPMMPHNPPKQDGQPTTPGLPLNPYITVDYFPDVTPRDGRANKLAETNPVTMVRSPVTNSSKQQLDQRASVGRQEPLAAADPVDMDPTNVPSGQPKATFAKHNAKQDLPDGSAGKAWSVPSSGTGRWDQTLIVPFHHMVHLDRKLVNTGELMHVAAVKPHEVTHQFAFKLQSASGGQPQAYLYAHTAPWADEAWKGVPQGQTARLGRALDFLRVADRTLEATFGGRVPGKVNINTVWDYEQFLALCDPQDGGIVNGVDVVNNDFARTQKASDGTNDVVPSQPYRRVPTGPTTTTPLTPMTVRQVWDQIAASRGLPGAAARPFWGGAGPIAPLDAAANETQFQLSGLPNTGANVPDAARVRSFHRDADANAIQQSGPNAGKLALGSLPRPSGLFDPYGDKVMRGATGGMELGATEPLTGHYQYDPLHSAQFAELWEKISDHVTTRSNVFAVYLTVGFFEVLDDSVSPPRLGGELGAQNGTSQRYHFLSVVDRTNLALDSFLPITVPQNAAQATALQNDVGRFQQASRWPAYFKLDWSDQVNRGMHKLSANVYGYTTGIPALPVYASVSGNPVINTYLARVPAIGASSGKGQFPAGAINQSNPTSLPTGAAGDFLAGNYDGGTWTVRPGDKLYLGQGDNMDVAQVTRVHFDDTNHANCYIEFALSITGKAHPYGEIISNVVPGNPGPQPKFDYRDPRYAPVVRYAGVIE